MQWGGTKDDKSLTTPAKSTSPRKEQYALPLYLIPTLSQSASRPHYTFPQLNPFSRIEKKYQEGKTEDILSN
jgi:hypothetical protein